MAALENREGPGMVGFESATFVEGNERFFVPIELSESLAVDQVADRIVGMAFDGAEGVLDGSLVVCFVVECVAGEGEVALIGIWIDGAEFESGVLRGVPLVEGHAAATEDFKDLRVIGNEGMNEFQVIESCLMVAFLDFQLSSQDIVGKGVAEDLDASVEGLSGFFGEAES